MKPHSSKHTIQNSFQPLGKLVCPSTFWPSCLHSRVFLCFTFTCSFPNARPQENASSFSQSCHVKSRVYVCIYLHLCVPERAAAKKTLPISPSYLHSRVIPCFIFTYTFRIARPQRKRFPFGRNVFHSLSRIKDIFTYKFPNAAAKKTLSI